MRLFTDLLEHEYGCGAHFSDPVLESQLFSDHIVAHSLKKTRTDSPAPYFYNLLTKTYVAEPNSKHEISRQVGWMNVIG